MARSWYDADCVHCPSFKLEMCLPIDCEQQRQAQSSTSVEGGSMAMQTHAPIESASVWYARTAEPTFVQQAWPEAWQFMQLDR